MQRPWRLLSCWSLYGYLCLFNVLLILTACSNPQVVQVPPPSSPRTQVTPPSVPVFEEPLSQSTAPRTIIHEVGPLETIWRLSKMYGVPMRTIYRANGLKPGATIRIGQKLVIPNAKPLRNVIALYPSSKWKYIIIHHTATDIGNAYLINRCHHDRGFWYGLGYDFLIDNGSLGKGDGQIEVSPRWIKQQDGAHCKAGGMNSQGIGIALVGNFDEELPTPEQMDSLVYLIKILCRQYHIPYSHVMGHRDVEGANTDCPGKRFPWPVLRQCLAKP